MQERRQGNRQEFVNAAPDDVAPDGSLVYYRELGARCASLVEIRLPPGESSTPVKHRTVEEIWYFLAGTGSVTVGGKVRNVGPGDTVVIPTGVVFSFRNASDSEPLRFLCYTSPPWPGADEAIVSKSEAARS